MVSNNHQAKHSLCVLFAHNQLFIYKVKYTTITEKVSSMNTSPTSHMQVWEREV